MNNKIVILGTVVVLFILVSVGAWMFLTTESTEVMRSFVAEETRSITVQPKKKTSASRNAGKVALIIGNGKYKNSPLRNPVNDARLIAGILNELGFEVTLLENGSMAEMKRQINNFGNKLSSASAGLFYYAGHGMQVKGQNYLIPVDSIIKSEEEVSYVSVNTGYVLSKMENAGCPVNIVILDACRDNPFARSFRSNSNKGLAFMDAPVGTIIGYATSPGAVAMDGKGKNSLYSGTLAQFIQEPGLKIEDVFKQVRRVVRGSTEGVQIPWESTSLEGDFFFNPNSDGTIRPLPPRVVIIEPDNYIPEPAIKNEPSISSGSSNSAFLLFNEAQQLKQEKKFDKARLKLDKALALLSKRDQDYQIIRDERCFHLPVAEAQFYLTKHKKSKLRGKIAELDAFLRKENGHSKRYEYSQVVDELRTSLTYLGIAISTNHQVFEKSFQMMMHNYWVDWGDYPKSETQFQERLIPQLNLQNKYEFLRYGRSQIKVWAEFKDLNEGMVFKIETVLM